MAEAPIMKYVTFYLLLLTNTLSYGQQNTVQTKIYFPLTENRIVYTAQVKTDTSFSKDQLFHNAEEWYQHNFQTADHTLTIENIADGKISGPGVLHDNKRQHDAAPGDISFTIDIIASKGMYEYRVHGIYSTDKNGKYYYSDMYNEEQYPTAKPKWAEADRHAKLARMDELIKDMISKMQTDMVKK